MTYQEDFNDVEWNLLVGLPQAVLAAASAAEDDSTRRTLAEGEAGLDAIGEGRTHGNPLVEAIAAELVERVGDPELGEEPPVVISPSDPGAMIQDCLARAKEATALLAGRVSEGDAGAYRHWLVTIAERVVEAAPTGGVLGIGGEQVTAAEQRFVHQLTVALND